MDYLKLDKVRKSTTPLQLDVVEAFAQGRLSRRQFIKRATVVGLSAGADLQRHHRRAVAARHRTAARRLGRCRQKTGGSIKVAVQRPVTLDPVGMQDLASYGLTAQSFEFLCTLSSDATDIAPGLAESWTPNSDNTVWTFKLRQGVTWHDGTPFTSADVVATMERLVTANNSGIRACSARVAPSQPMRTRSRSPSSARTATSRTSCRSTTPRR